jgi:hypothetical protein
VSESVAEGTEESVATGEETAVEAATEAEATDFAAQATEYKNRFAGSQKKLTETLNSLKAIEQERDALRKFKADAERANMSEMERLQAELEDAKREAATARSEAQRASLAAKFPQSFATLGEATPLDESVLTALEAKLAGGGEESEQETRIDPNNPRKTPPTPVDPLAPVNDWLMSTLSNQIGGI